MQAPVWKPAVPRAILLSTDLSNRCDRALDRALSLARQWDARLIAVTVVEPDAGLIAKASSAKAGKAAADPLLLASLQMRRDVATTGTDVPVEVLVREGRVGPQIDAVAAETGCSLIVTGTARNEPFGRIMLGSTVDWLSRTSTLPLLTVHSRVHGPYSRIVVASDFSASSQHALETVCTLLPDARPSLFHAFDVPFLGLMDTQRDEVLAQGEADARAAAKEFLREAGYPALPMVVVHGDPVACLREHAQDDGNDLIVIASHGRSAIYKILIGSVAQRILETAPCDTLLVPEPQARGVK